MQLLLLNELSIKWNVYSTDDSLVEQQLISLPWFPEQDQTLAVATKASAGTRLCSNSVAGMLTEFRRDWNHQNPEILELAQPFKESFVDIDL